eukprot:s507_g17.t1
MNVNCNFGASPIWRQSHTTPNAGTISDHGPLRSKKFAPTRLLGQSFIGRKLTESQAETDGITPPLDWMKPSVWDLEWLDIFTQSLEEIVGHLRPQTYWSLAIPLDLGEAVSLKTQRRGERRQRMEAHVVENLGVGSSFEAILGKEMERIATQTTSEFRGLIWRNL